MSTLQPPRSVVILGVPFHDVTMDETIARLDRIIARRDAVYWATANLDFTYQASEDVELQRILIEADLVLCDGTPLVWASKALGAPLRERVTGSDLVPRLAAEASGRGWRLFLLGGGDDSLPVALENLRAKHPGLQVDGYSPPFAKLLDMDTERIAEKIAAFKPDVLLVAFGCPKQEKWIYMHYRKLGVPMSVGVGATVDFLAGKFRRAPRWMQVIGTEWIFRLSQEPRRLFNRYLFDLLFFVRTLRKQRRALAARGGGPGGESARAFPAPMVQSDVKIVRWERRADAAAIASGALPNPSAGLAPGGIIALDTTAVTFMDSSGLGLLIAAYRRAVSAGGGLVLVRPSQPVRALMEAMRLSRLVPMVEDEAAARAALGLARPAPSGANAGELVLTVQGELTATRVTGLTNWIEESWEGRPDVGRLVLDLSSVRFMDSSGLGLLIRCLRMAAKRPGKFVVRGANENVRNVIRMARLDTLDMLE